MPVRSAMQPLVDRLRKAIGDVRQPQVFDDDDLQSALDERRVRVSAVALIEDAVVSGSPTVFRAPFGFWESAALETSSGVVTADADDPINGVWTFAGAPGVPVYATGYAYDLWGSAANLLEEWAARVALEFDFGTDQQQFDRSQKREGLLKVAREFGRRAIQPRSRGVSW